MTDKIRNLYQIIMVKMSTINDVIMTGNLFSLLTQCNIYKPQWLRNCHFIYSRMGAILLKRRVTESINNFLSILMCTYINRSMNIYKYIQIQYRNTFNTMLFTLFSAVTFNIPKWQIFLYSVEKGFHHQQWFLITSNMAAIRDGKRYETCTTQDAGVRTAQSA